MPNTMHNFGSSSASKSSSSVFNGVPQTITNTQVSGNAAASASANAQVNDGFGFNQGFPLTDKPFADVNFGTKVDEENKNSCQNKEQEESGFEKNNKSQRKSFSMEQGGFGQNCNCVCKGIKFFDDTDTDSQSTNADFKGGINIDTRFGTDVFYKSGTFPKGPSSGVSSSSSAQSFPDGSGSFEVSASKIPA
ncbi:uncharacterized protein LOC122501908 [Leptopilina heterotoma]|uniref:uncharacterized protein LOC122501908 n=1 Tax=Leptopilina heterotoma TaxID=63436 RepID=UPI001CA84A45|nr:uncharacterized protein LOC122501908 [Leptopilina heterotoma]